MSCVCVSTHFSQMTGLCIDSALLQLWSLHSECVCGLVKRAVPDDVLLYYDVTHNNTVGVIIKNIDYCFSWITTSRECTYFQNHVPTSSKDLEDLNTLSPLCSSFYTLIIQLETSRFRCSLQLWSLEGGSCGVNQTSWNIQRRALQDPSPCWNCLLVFSL